MRLNSKSEIRGAHAPSRVAGCALASGVGARIAGAETPHDSVPPGFSARARKTAPEGGCAPRSNSAVWLNVTLPVRNGAALLAANAPRVSAFLEQHWPGEYELVIAENGSTDATGAVAERLAAELPATRVVRVAQAGRGGALRAVWGASAATVLSYMDVDLATDLAALPGLVRAVAEEGFALAVGSRLANPETTRRGWRREVLSRGHNGLARALVGLPVSDAQCGFKAIHRGAARALLPRVRDERWFFDTELLALAAREGFRIREIPVTWTEARTSQVRIVGTVWEMVRGMWRVRRGAEGGARVRREERT